MAIPAPSLRIERALLRERGGILAAVDEVGRGALAGPVSVGVVVIDASVKPAPPGVRDSKLLPAAAREALVDPIRRWALDHAVGHATNDEIDAVGIIAALRLAAERAIDEIAARGRAATQALLDGSHDWLTPPEPTLFDDPPDGSGVALRPAIPVTVRVRADLACAAVAAASILAKVERDAAMIAAHERFPAYDWAANKGYASPSHRDGLLANGACELHRRSWNLLSTDPGELPDRPQAAAPA